MAQDSPLNLTLDLNLLYNGAVPHRVMESVR